MKSWELPVASRGLGIQMTTARPTARRMWAAFASSSCSQKSHTRVRRAQHCNTRASHPALLPQGAEGPFPKPELTIPSRWDHFNMADAPEKEASATALDLIGGTRLLRRVESRSLFRICKCSFRTECPSTFLQSQQSQGKKENLC